MARITLKFMKNILSLSVPFFWLLSFFFSLPLVQPYELSRFLAVLCALHAAVIVIGSPANRGVRLSLNRPVFFMLAFSVWLGLSFFWSVSPFVTIISWGSFLLLPLWFLIFVYAPFDRDQLLTSLRLFVGALTALAAWGLIQFFILPEYLSTYGSIRHPFADPNNFAGLLNMGMFVALGLFLYERQKPYAVLYVMAGIAMAMVMILIGSRVALAVMIVTALFMMLVCRFARHNDYKMGFGSLLLLAAIIVATFLISSIYNLERVTAWERLTHMVLLLKDPSWLARMDIWASTITLICESIWQGTGLGTFFLLYPSVRHDTEVFSAGLMAHADPLQFWQEAGLPAVLLFYAFLIVMLGRFIGAWRTAPRFGNVYILIVALFCGLLTLVMHLHLTFHLYVPALLTATGLLAGLFIRLSTNETQTSRTVSMPLVGHIFLLLIGGFMVAYSSCLYSERMADLATERLAANDLEGFSDAVNRAGKAGFGLNPRPYVLAATIPLGLIQTGRMPESERIALFSQTNDLLERSLARSRINPGAYYAKALLFGAMKRPGFEDYLALTLKYDPKHPQAGALQKAVEGHPQP